MTNLKHRAIQWLICDRNGYVTNSYRITKLRHAMSWWMAGFIPFVDADVRRDGSVYWFRIPYVSPVRHTPRVLVVDPDRPAECGTRLQPDGRVYPPLWPACFLPVGHHGAHICGVPEYDSTHIEFDSKTGELT